MEEEWETLQRSFEEQMRRAEGDMRKMGEHVRRIREQMRITGLSTSEMRQKILDLERGREQLLGRLAEEREARVRDKEAANAELRRLKKKIRHIRTHHESDSDEPESGMHNAGMEEDINKDQESLDEKRAWIAEKRLEIDRKIIEAEKNPNANIECLQHEQDMLDMDEDLIDQQIEAGSESESDGSDSNVDRCRICKTGGHLILCDGCPEAYHLECIDLDESKIPDKFYCKGVGQKCLSGLSNGPSTHFQNVLSSMVEDIDEDDFIKITQALEKEGKLQMDSGFGIQRYGLEYEKRVEDKKNKMSKEDWDREYNPNVKNTEIYRRKRKKPRTIKPTVKKSFGARGENFRNSFATGSNDLDSNDAHAQNSATFNDHGFINDDSEEVIDLPPLHARAKRLRKLKKEIVGKVIEYRTSPSNIDKAKIIKVGDMKDGLLEGRVRNMPPSDTTFETPVSFEFKDNGEQFIHDEFDNKFAFVFRPVNSKKERSQHAMRGADARTDAIKSESLAEIPDDLWDETFFQQPSTSSEPNHKKIKKKRLRRDNENVVDLTGEKDEDGIEEESPKTSKKKRKSKKKKRTHHDQKRNPTKKKRSDDDVSHDADLEEFETSNLFTSPRKRRNIAKIIDDSELSQEQKKAEKEEQERLRRIETRKKLLALRGVGSNSFDDKKVPLNSPNTESLDLYLSKDVSGKLKKHQIEGIHFMWDNVVESTEILYKGGKGSGCILSHLMGLGKTLQAIAFIQGFLNHQLGKHAIVICPVNVLHNWESEFNIWFSDEERPRIFSVRRGKNAEKRLECLQNWEKEGGVLLIGFEMLVSLCGGRKTVKKKSNKLGVAKVIQDKKNLESNEIKDGSSNEANMVEVTAGRETHMVEIQASEKFRKIILEVADLAILDEGHRIKNDKSGVAKILKDLETKRRIVLTGTPMQNNLVEYFHMIDFVKPGLLVSEKVFRNRFVNPIENGRCSDSTREDIKRMKRRIYVLHRKTQAFIHRRGYQDVEIDMPKKHEYTIFVRLTELQKDMYNVYLDSVEMRNKSRLLVDHSCLKKIWNHPYILLRQYEKMMHETKRKNAAITTAPGSLKQVNKSKDPENLLQKDQTFPNSHDGIPQTETSPTAFPTTSPTVVQTPISSNSNSKEVIREAQFGADLATSLQNQDSIAEQKESSPFTTALQNQENMAAFATASHNDEKIRSETPDTPLRSGDDDVKSLSAVNPTLSRLRELLPEDAKFEDADTSSSSKLQVCMELLDMITSRGEKVLIFSFSLGVLDVIENCMRKTKGYMKGKNYFRLDGNVSGDEREGMISKFNLQSDAESPKIFLISTKAGGIGVNLIGANHAIIYDVGWNPSHNNQAIYRIFRFGQRKTTYIYRLVAHGTMEQGIYERCITKEGMSRRVVDKKQISNQFQRKDLENLYRRDYQAFDNSDDVSDVEHDEQEPTVIEGANSAQSDGEPNADGSMPKTDTLISTMRRNNTVYNPYEQKHVQMPPNSLMWWLLAKFGREKQAISARKTIEIAAKKSPAHVEYLIKGFHAPQLLLKHIDADVLTEEEKRHARIEFENLVQTRNQPTIQPPPESWPENPKVKEVSNWTRKELKEFMVLTSIYSLALSIRYVRAAWLVKRYISQKIETETHICDYCVTIYNQSELDIAEVEQQKVLAKIQIGEHFLLMKESFIERVLGVVDKKQAALLLFGIMYLIQAGAHHKEKYEIGPLFEQGKVYFRDRTAQTIDTAIPMEFHWDLYRLYQKYGYVA